MDKVLDSVLSREMDRKEFLLNIGVLFVSLVGINSALKLLSGEKDSKHQAQGYGSSPYGR